MGYTFPPPNTIRVKISIVAFALLLRTIALVRVAGELLVQAGGGGGVEPYDDQLMIMLVHIGRTIVLVDNRPGSGQFNVLHASRGVDTRQVDIHT